MGVGGGGGCLLCHFLPMECLNGSLGQYLLLMSALGQEVSVPDIVAGTDECTGVEYLRMSGILTPKMVISCA